MPNLGAQTESRHEAPIRDIRQSMFVETMRTARHAIDYALSQGDHAEVWELICDMPDSAGPRHVQWYTSEIDNLRVPVYLGARDRVGMSDDLRQYAIDHGWDEDKGKASVGRLMEQRRGRIAGLAATMKGRVRG